MYDVGEKQDAFRRSWEALSAAVDKDDVESALVLRRNKSGSFAYYYVGEDTSPYAWIGFLEYIKTEFINSIYGDIYGQGPE